MNRVYAKCLFLRNDYTGAVKVYNFLTDQGDNSYNTLLYKGISFFYCDSMKQAYSTFQPILKTKKQTDPNVLVYLGIAAIHIYEVDEGIDYLEAAIDLLQPNDNTMELIYSNLANGYIRKRDNVKKIAMLKNAYKHVQKPLTLYNIAYTYDVTGNSKSAMDYYQRYINSLSGKKNLSKLESECTEYASTRITEIKAEEFFKQ